MTSRAGSRRRWARGVGAVTIAIAGLLIGSLPTGSASAQSYPDGLLPPGNWSAEQADYLLNMIDEAERVLPEAFPAVGTQAEVNAALEPLGFVDIGPRAPGGYWHFVNRSWVFDEHTLNPEYAESLVYQGPSDNMRLVAAMYILPVSSVDDVPDDIKWLPGWHTHPELCRDDQGRIVGGAPNCPPGSQPADDGPMVHVWIVDNDCGHRFGGVGVGGLHCDDHGHPGGNGHGHDDDDHSNGNDYDNDDDAGHDHDDNGVGRPAPAVPGIPSYTG